MARSEDFETNLALLLDLVDSIPPGRCTTYGALGTALGIVPRYVALIMASAPEISTCNWHRVVGSGGVVKPGPQRPEQLSRLRKEGVDLIGDRIVDFDSLFARP